MDYRIPVIYQYPSGILETLDAQGRYAILQQIFSNMFGDRLDLGSAFTGTDDKIVGNDREILQFKNRYMPCLFI